MAKKAEVSRRDFIKTDAVAAATGDDLTTRAKLLAGRARPCRPFSINQWIQTGCFGWDLPARRSDVSL